MKVFTFVMAFVLAMAGGLYAQNVGNAQLSGTVKDQSGAVLPGVEVKATQTETGLTREIVTNETGSYSLPNLPVGPYRLEAALPGFRTYVQSGIILQVGFNPTVNGVLQVGAFFQADDGIRDRDVTGVQTCALPICWRRSTAWPRT